MSSDRGVMRDVILSIRPEWVEKILSGEKTVEIRKKIWKTRSINVWIYETAPKQMVVAKFHSGFHWDYEYTIEGLERMNNTREAMLQQSCLKHDELLKYAGGGEFFCIPIWDLKKLEKPLPLSAFGVQTPPQNFCYVREIPEVIK